MFRNSSDSTFGTKASSTALLSPSTATSSCSLPSSLARDESRNEEGRWTQGTRFAWQFDCRLGLDDGLFPASSRIDLAQWTKCSATSDKIEHLVALYFSWEYPLFSPISKDHFMSDFLSGDTKYCSSLLVNAILAIGCKFSNQHDDHLQCRAYKFLAAQFVHEAERLLPQKEDIPTVTSIQAMSLLAMFLTSCGLHARARSHLRRAVECVRAGYLPWVASNSQCISSDEAVCKVTVWGVFTLEQ